MKFTKPFIVALIFLLGACSSEKVISPPTDILDLKVYTSQEIEENASKFPSAVNVVQLNLEKNPDDDIIEKFAVLGHYGTGYVFDNDGNILCDGEFARHAGHYLLRPAVFSSGIDCKQNNPAIPKPLEQITKGLQSIEDLDYDDYEFIVLYTWNSNVGRRSISQEFTDFIQAIPDTTKILFLAVQTDLREEWNLIPGATAHIERSMEKVGENTYVQRTTMSDLPKKTY